MIFDSTGFTNLHPSHMGPSHPGEIQLQQEDLEVFLRHVEASDFIAEEFRAVAPAQRLTHVTGLVSSAGSALAVWCWDADGKAEVQLCLGATCWKRWEIMKNHGKSWEFWSDMDIFGDMVGEYLMWWILDGSWWIKDNRVVECSTLYRYPMYIEQIGRNSNSYCLLFRGFILKYKMDMTSSNYVLNDPRQKQSLVHSTFSSNVAASILNHRHFLWFLCFKPTKIGGLWHLVGHIIANHLSNGGQAMIA